MAYDFKDEVKLFMVFDILGDLVRSGPLQWQVDRKRLESVKDHILDLILIFRILKKHFPSYINSDKVIDYILCHDLPEAITGDITKFEGISDLEKERVTNLAIKYLHSKFKNVLDLETIINNYEQRIDIESKIVKMIDKVHSASTFIKYESEKPIDVNNPNIMPVLINDPYVQSKIALNEDVADMFFEFHTKAINITDEECIKYKISKEDASKITNVILAFIKEMHNQKLTGTLFDFKNDFPKDAMIYNKNK